MKKEEDELIANTAIATLIEMIKEEILKGKQKIEYTIETEKTATYWNIGKHIHEHLLNYRDRAEYGDYLFNTLDEALTIHKRTLYRAVQFYETYPEIVTILSQLKWSHFLVLLTVKDEKKRHEYEKKVINENLTVQKLKEIIKEDKEEDNSNTITQLTETRGYLNTYKLKEKEGTLNIDLGFRFYINKLNNSNNNYTGDSIVQIIRKKNSYTITLAENISSHGIYTYKGTLWEIIDGDTLWVDLNLGFGTWTRQKVRLRGINTPKIETGKGIEVKRYIERKLTPCTFLIVKTYYRDKFNRYLADIFYDKNETKLVKVAETGVYLNQELLDKGFAEKY